MKTIYYNQETDENFLYVQGYAYVKDRTYSGVIKWEESFITYKRTIRNGIAIEGFNV